MQAGRTLDGNRNHEKNAALQTVLDRIRTRWGARGVRVGAQ